MPMSSKRVNAAYPYGVRLWDAWTPATRWTYDSARASTTQIYLARGGESPTNAPSRAKRGPHDGGIRKLF